MPIHRRGGLIAEFLLGVVGTKDANNQPHKFHTFCKVGTGMTGDEMASMNQQISWKTWDDHDPPPHYMMSHWTTIKSDDKPHVWCKPEDSCILQVHGYEICDCETMSAGMTLRFPRIARWRKDKEWWECECLKDLKVGLLYKPKEGKRPGEGLVFLESRQKKRQKTHKSNAKRTGVISGMAPVDTSGIEVEGKCFLDSEFQVMLKASDPDKKDLEIMIHKNGGKAVGTSSSGYVIAKDTSYLKVKNFMSSAAAEERNIMNPAWVKRCVQAGKLLLPPAPQDLVHTCPQLLKEQAQAYDQFGDPFAVATSIDSIKPLLEKMVPPANIYEASAQPSIRELKNGSTFPSIFLGVVAYIDRRPLSSLPDEDHVARCEELTLAGIEVSLYGGLVSEKLDGSVTHILVSSQDLCRSADSHHFTEAKSCKVVSHAWVGSCISDGSRLPESLFAIMITL